MKGGDYFLAGVILAVGAVLLVLAMGWLDSGGVEYDPQHTLQWDDYREIDASDVLGASGALEIVSIAGTAYLHAAETGYGKVVHMDGKTDDYKVTKATCDIIIMNGQSNSAYYWIHDWRPESDKAPAPEIGTCYYFGRLTDPAMNYLIGSIEDYEIHDFIDPNTGDLRIGDKGPGICTEYYKATGHKVFWIQIGIVAKHVAAFVPPSASCWTYDLSVMTMFNEDLADLPVEIDRTIMYWAQGEGDKSAGTSIATYKSRFMQFWDAAPAAWGHDIETCYMVSGRTNHMGIINTALAELAAEHDNIKMAVLPALIDSFTVANGLMVDDNLHYTQLGDNAVANACVRYALADMGYHVEDPAPIYLMQATATATVGGTYTAPGLVTTYRTDLSTGLATVTWDSLPGTDETGLFVAEGTAAVPESLILAYAPAPMLIVTVTE